MSMQAKAAAGRHGGIDLFRFVMAIAVVAIHVVPRDLGVGAPLWSNVAEALGRAGVPFFFAASGYFLAARRPEGAQILLRPLRRLLPIHLFWLALYLAVFAVYPLRPFSLHVSDIVTGGVAFHLWFLPALGFAMVLVGAALRFVPLRVALPVAGAAAALGLALSGYRGVLGIPGPAQRSGMLIAPVLVLLGAAVRLRPPAIGLRGAALATAASLALCLGELYLVTAAAPAVPIRGSFLLSTFLIGPSLLLLARALPVREATGTALGRLSLPIYMVHLLVLWTIDAVFPFDQNLPGRLEIFLLTALASTLVAAVLVRIRFLRRVL